MKRMTQACLSAVLVLSLCAVACAVHCESMQAALDTAENDLAGYQDWRNDVQATVAALIITYHWTGDVYYLNKAQDGMEVLSFIDVGISLFESEIAQLEQFMQNAGCG